MQVHLAQDIEEQVGLSVGGESFARCDRVSAQTWVICRGVVIYRKPLASNGIDQWFEAINLNGLLVAHSMPEIPIEL